jgi:hypothetical protein
MPAAMDAPAKNFKSLDFIIVVSPSLVSASFESVGVDLRQLRGANCTGLISSVQTDRGKQ